MLVENVKDCVENFSSIYIFSVQNMRNEKMKEVRIDWKPSKFFFGKNRVISVGLGRTKAEESHEDLHKISQSLKGQMGLLFTNKDKEYVSDWFKNYESQEYARSGFKVKETISLPAGPLSDFSHAIEPYLRQLGMPTTLERGVVTLLKDYTICKKGNVLTPEQAKILQLLDMKLAKFKLVLKGVWIKDKGFEKFDTEIDDDAEDNEGGNDDEEMEVNDDEDDE